MTTLVVPVRYRHLGGALQRPGVEAPDLTRIPREPLVSCLCVTENRHAFMPWLLWNFDRQAWKKRELVIVDSSDPPIEIPNRGDVRVVRTPLGTWLGKKRNLALQEARGEVVAWFDDDDWQHPQRLSMLVPMLAEYAAKLGASFIGPSRSFFVDIQTGRCEPYRMKDYAIFNGSVFYTELVRHAHFAEDVLRNEDTLWLSSLLRTRRGASLEGDCPSLFLWLSHDANISNRRNIRRIHGKFEEMFRTIYGGWGDTSAQLAALRARLAERPAMRPVRALVAEGAHIADLSRLSSPSASGAEASAIKEALALPGKPPSAAPAPAEDREVQRRLPNTRGRSESSRISIYAFSTSPRGVPHGAKVVPYQISKSPLGEAAAIGAVAMKRHHEWSPKDYVGFLYRTDADGTAELAELTGEADRTLGRYDVYAYTAGRSELLRKLLRRASPQAEAVFRHVVVSRMGRSAALLEREVAVIQKGFILRPPILTQYVRDWLVPARARFADRSDRELRRLLSAGSADPVVEEIFKLLPSVFFLAARCRLLPIATNGHARMKWARSNEAPPNRASSKNIKTVRP